MAQGPCDKAHNLSLMQALTGAIWPKLCSCHVLNEGCVAHISMDSRGNPENESFTLQDYPYSLQPVLAYVLQLAALQVSQTTAIGQQWCDGKTSASAKVAFMLMPTRPSLPGNAVHAYR